MVVPTALSFGTASLAAVMVLIVALRARRTVSDAALLAGIVLLALEFVFSGLSLGAPNMDLRQHWDHWRLATSGLVPAAWLLFALSYARGNATVFLHRWGWVLVAAAVLPLLLVAPTHRLLFSGIRQYPEGVMVALGPTGIALHIVMVLGAVLVLMNLERTFRAAVGTARWRIKFVLLGVGVLFIVRIYSASQALMFRRLDPSHEVVAALGASAALVVIFRGLLRATRLTSDLYPSLSVLQGSVTITLVGVYLVAVGVLGRVAVLLGGDASLALKAFLVLASLVGLAVVLQSDRLRLHLRRLLSRHFQRPVYDYRTIWRKFSDATATCVEQTDLCRTSVRTIADIFQALAVGIWLVNDRRDGLALAASTSLSESRGRELAPTASDVHRLVQHFENNPEAVDIETLPDAWADIIRRLHPSDFPNGGNRLCVPLLRQRRFEGLIVLGDRINGIAFPMQDFDLLKCIGDQVTASLVNLRMSQQLLQAKEFEAFQTMATFFVHDLKNAASTLNLMLRNLPVHFDNPEFRADALRAVSKAASHINRLTSRLGVLRHELRVRPVPRDLNDVVRAALSSFDSGTGIKVQTNLAASKPGRIDSEQLQKVITNLVLNAAEAMANDGTIEVTTSDKDGGVSLEVTDHGCGMTEEFLRDSLFRPFKTTKQHGLGIGMFQSRMIVEAHGGHIQVTSELGSGSTFRIFIPTAPASESTAAPVQTAGAAGSNHTPHFV